MNDIKNLHLVFDARTLDYIAFVLAQQPYKEVAPVLADIREQISSQQKTGGTEGPPQGGIPMTVNAESAH